MEPLRPSILSRVEGPERSAPSPPFVLSEAERSKAECSEVEGWG